MIGDYSAESLLPLLEAASVSPTAAHRALSIATLFHALVQRRHTGVLEATPDDLPKLVQRALACEPVLATKEDFAPFDPADEVLATWGADLFRLLPGAFERPVALVNEHDFLAGVIDSAVIDRLGFGLRDVGELVLRRLDEVARVLSDAWPSGAPASPGDVPVVTQLEIDAVGRLRTTDDLVAACSNPTRAAAALAHYTRSVSQVAFDPSHSTATFGATIAVRLNEKLTMLPAGSLLDALPAIGADLAVLAASKRHVREAFSGLSGNRVGRQFRGSAQAITGPISVGSGSTLHSLITYNDRQVLALHLAAGLTPMEIQAQLDEGAEALAQVRAGTLVSNPATSWNIPENAEVVRLQLIASPLHTAPLRVSGLWMRVEDLRWIVYSSLADPDSLWYFVRDLGNPAGVGQLFAWDMLDKWEVWRPQRSFHRGGTPISAMFFEPHASSVEWDEAALAAPVERALHRLGLPSLHHWPIVDLHASRGADVGDTDREISLQLTDTELPVAVSKLDPSGPRGSSSVLWSLAVGVIWKLEQIDDSLQVAASASQLNSLIVTWAHVDRDSGPPLSFGGLDDNVLEILWDDRLEVELAKDSSAIEELCGELVCLALAPSTRPSFSAAWNEAPPGIRIDGFTTRQRAQQLQPALTPHQAVRSDVLRQLGELISARGIEPGEYPGPEAVRIESQTVFPWLLEQFHRSIADLDPVTLLEFAVVELERVHHERVMVDRRIGWERGFPTSLGNDHSAARESVARATRVASLAVEEILAHPPDGSMLVNELGWQRSLSIADLCIESALRSDDIHHRLRNTAVRISHNFEALPSFPWVIFVRGGAGSSRRGRGARAR